jgi:hypothetical protein
MMRAQTTVVVLLALLGWPPGRAAAQEIPCQGGPCVARRQPRQDGSHFLVEVNGGGTLVGGRGPMVGGLFGVGGKLRRLPFRFYAISEFAYSGSTDEGISTALGLPFRDQRARRDLDFGLRVYLPIWGPVRIFGDVLGGASYLTATLQRDGLPTLSSGAWQGHAVAATGLQIRIISQLSIGARVRFALTGEEPDALRATMGATSHQPITFMAGMTWHF